MKKNKLVLIGYIDDQLVEKADKYMCSKKKNTWVRWGAMAACLCLIVGAVFAIPKMLNNKFATNPAQRPIGAYIQADVKAATVYHTVQGRTTRTVITGHDLYCLRDWTNNMTYTLTDGNGKMQPDNVENAEVFKIELEEGDYPGFSYVICEGEGAYLLIEGYWYSVENPSTPPVAK